MKKPGLLLMATIFTTSAALNLISPPEAVADDVYNFYFQKGPGPRVVNQGGGQQASRAPTADEAPIHAGPDDADVNVQSDAPGAAKNPANPPLPAKLTAPAPAPVESSADKHFAILPGYYHVHDSLGTSRAYSLAAQYNFNRYIGARLQAHLLASEDDHEAKASIDPDQAENRWGGMASLVFTPIRVELIGHRFVDISVHGGVMSQRILGDMNTDGSSNRKVSLNGRAFAGASVNVALNDNFGVEGFASLAEGGQLGQAGASLVLQF